MEIGYQFFISRQELNDFCKKSKQFIYQEQIKEDLFVGIVGIEPFLKDIFSARSTNGSGHMTAKPSSVILDYYLKHQGETFSVCVKYIEYQEEWILEDLFDLDSAHYYTKLKL